MHRLAPILLTLLLLPTNAKTAGIQTESDLAYGSHPLQKLDLYIPAKPEKAPVMVYIHGGGWVKGDKDAVGVKPAFFTGKGWIFVSLNYRLLPEGRHPENVNDVSLALAKVHDKVAEKGGDPERIFVMGHSAGAHLAALVATDPKPLEKAGKSLKILKGVIALDTNAYDLPKLIAASPSDLYTAVFGTDPAGLIDASPQLHVTPEKGIPPFLICYSRGMGERPQPMRTAAAEAFKNALSKAGIAAEIVDASDRNHGEINQWFGKPDDTRVTARAWEFLEKLAGA